MKALFHLNKYLLKYKISLLLGILFVTISVVFKVSQAKFIKGSFNTIEVLISNISSQEGGDLSELQKSLLYYGLLIIGAALLQGMFMFFMRQTIIVMSRKIEYDLKNEIFNHYQDLNLAFYKRNNTGDLMNRISEDVSRVRMYIGPAIMYSINVFVLITITVSMMLEESVKLTLLTLIPLPILSYAVYRVSNMINKRSTKVQEQLSTLSTFAQETFSGIRVLKAYGREDQWREDHNNEAEEYHKRNKGLYTINALFFPLMIFLIGLSVLLVVYVGGNLVIDQTIKTGVIVEFIIYVNMLTWPIASIGWVTSIIQRAAASQVRINEFLNTKPEIVNNSQEPFEVKGEIEFKDVSFTFPDSGIKALKSVSFKLEEGKTLAIVGRTGSGKTTVGSLLGRVFDTTTGSISIDGVNIKDINLDDLRSNMSYVPQEGFLFSDSIYSNIAFGIDNPTQEIVETAAKHASIHQNIIDFPEGYNTKVGERGVTLSGGQKQRVSIARALIVKPQILVLDDCLSAVDIETEEFILQNLKQFSSSTTTIIISHRVSSVKHADTIIVLDEGEIIEAGSHSELIDAKGYYNSLYQKQLKTLEKPNSIA